MGPVLLVYLFWFFSKLVFVCLPAMTFPEKSFTISRFNVRDFEASRGEVAYCNPLGSLVETLSQTNQSISVPVKRD